MSLFRSPARRYLIPVIVISILVIPLGYFYVGWSKAGTGAGIYSRDWKPDSGFGYWHPEAFYQPVQSVAGKFDGEQCVQCHSGVTPGIVNDWRTSRHASPGNGKSVVYCDSCHGKDHQALRMPTTSVCGTCHGERVREFQDERRFGFPSHALALERAVDAKHFADKPKAEVASCLQCHSVAAKCDSCHTRHRFSPTEARRPEACVTCHSGPPHPDDETYYASAHGQRYLKEGKSWDWTKPLVKGNYPAPTCAYCHMRNGYHQVADKTIWKFGLQEVNPLTSGNEVRRKAWVDVCSDCHDAEWSAESLRGLDRERKQAWSKLYAAENLLRSLRADDLLHPAAAERPPYPMDFMEAIKPRARIGYFDGQASAFYNVSPIERDYFEMWYFDNLGAYKAAAHGAADIVARQHEKLGRSLRDIEQKARTLREQGDRTRAGSHWRQGEYTDYNREQN